MDPLVCRPTEERQNYKLSRITLGTNHRASTPGYLGTEVFVCFLKTNINLQGILSTYFQLYWLNKLNDLLEYFSRPLTLSFYYKSARTLMFL